MPKISNINSAAPYIALQEEAEPTSGEENPPTVVSRLDQGTISDQVAGYARDTSDAEEIRLLDVLKPESKALRRKLKRGRGKSRLKSQSRSDFRKRDGNAQSDSDVIGVEFVSSRRSAAGRIYAACIGKEIQTDQVINCLHGTNWNQVQHMSDENSDGSVLFQQDMPDAGMGGRLFAFVFDFGCIVCWNCQKSDELSFIRSVLAVTSKPAKPGDEYFDEDDLTFVLGGNSTRIRNNRVALSSTHPIEMFAISLAFAQSVKLSVYEGEADDVIQQSRSYPESLALTGKIPVTQTTVQKKVGQLFLLRYEIFLDSEMLDTPEYFWESDEYEPIYAKARTYLEMDKRMGLLNQRLDIVRELLDMLSQALENSHANRLELIIMVLVAAEVICQVFFSLFDTTCWSFCSEKQSNVQDL